MSHSKIKFFTGNGIINPDFSLGIKNIALFIASIEPLLVYLLTHVVPVNNPYAVIVFISPEITINTSYLIAAYPTDGQKADN
jgi:hypothetical protein